MSLKVRGNSIISFILLIPATKAFALQQSTILDNIFDYWGMISCIMCIALNIRKRMHPLRDYSVIKCMAVLCAIYLLSTVIYHPDQMIGAISELSRIWIIPLFITFKMKSENQLVSSLKNIHELFYTVLIIDSITCVAAILGHGMYEAIEYSYLGLDNFAAFSIVSMIESLLVISAMVYGKIRFRDYTILLVCLILKIVTGSLAAAASLIVMLFVIMLFQRKNGKTVYKKMIFISIFIASITIIFTPVGDILAKSVETIFGRDSVIARVTAWKYVIRLIKMQPFIGYGKMTGDQFSGMLLDVGYYGRVDHPHNFVLACLFTLGISGMFILIIYIRFIFNTIKKSDNGLIKNVVFSGLMGLLLIMIMDAYIFIPYYFVLLLLIEILNMKTSLRCKI